MNGLLITRAKLPAFIATLSMMTIARGLANIITDGRQIVGYPDWFDSFATDRHFGFLSLTVALAVAMSPRQLDLFALPRDGSGPCTPLAAAPRWRDWPGSVFGK